MAYKNKVLLRVKKDLNGWFNFSKWKYRLQLTGDTRDWKDFFLVHYAKKLGKKNFMKDFTEILEAMEKDNNQPIFTLYELQEVIYGNVSNKK